MQNLQSLSYLQFVTLCAICMAAATCTPSTHLSQPSAQVTPHQLRQAEKIVRSLDYLPFDVRADGCFARAFYTGAELATAGIPSSILLVSANSSERLYVQPGDAWNFHVAVLVGVDTIQFDRDAKNLVIFDRSTSDGLLSPREWLARLHATDVALSHAPVSTLMTMFAFGKDTANTTPLPASFAALPKFEGPHFKFACGSLQNLIRAKGTAVEERLQRLQQRTIALVKELERKDKIVDSRAAGCPK